MKRYLLLITPLILIFTMVLSSCSLEEMSRDSELNAAAETTYDELSSTFSGESGQFSLVTEYLKSWANKNEMDVAENQDHYMVLTNPATAGCESSQSTVLQCPVRTNDFNNSMQPLAIALTSLLGPEEHGDITLIITEIDDGQLIGASSVDPKYYQCDNFINLDFNNDVSLVTSGAYEMTSTMTTPVETAEPAYSHAFAITMSISGYHDPFDFDQRYPNPVETIGSLLATEKSSGQLFNLASFECESADGYTPTSATAVVIVDSNDVDSFTRRFNSSYNNMKDRFENLNDNFVYTLTETTMPETVMSSQSSDNIISLMYTLQTGIYRQDENSGNIIAAAGISSVTTSGGAFTLTMVSRSTDSSVMDEMSQEFLTTSGLCNISYSATDPFMTWSSDSKNGAGPFLTDALGSEESIIDSTVKSSECGIFSSKADDLNIISYQCNINHMDAALTNILNFTDSLNP